MVLLRQHFPHQIAFQRHRITYVIKLAVTQHRGEGEQALIGGPCGRRKSVAISEKSSVNVYPVFHLQTPLAVS